MRVWVVACVYTCGWMDGRLCVRTTLQASPTAAPLYSYANSNTHQCSQCNQGFADVSVAVKSEGGQRALEALHHDLLPGLVALLQVRARLCRWFLAYMYIYVYMYVYIHPLTTSTPPPSKQTKNHPTGQRGGGPHGRLQQVLRGLLRRGGRPALRPAPRPLRTSALDSLVVGRTLSCGNCQLNPLPAAAQTLTRSIPLTIPTPHPDPHHNPQHHTTPQHRLWPPTPSRASGSRSPPPASTWRRSSVRPFFLGCVYVFCCVEHVSASA